MTTGETTTLTRRTFVDKVMSLLFNMLSTLVITFLPRSKHLLISWLQSPSAVILEPKEIKSDTVSTVGAGRHFAMYANIDSLCSTPKTNTVLYVSYILSVPSVMSDSVAL